MSVTKTMLPLLAITFALLAQLPNSAGVAAASKSNVDQIMIENEKAVWAAAKAKDVTRFNRLVAEDARMVFESGVLTRADYLNGLPDRTIAEFHLTDFIALRPNPETVILIYKASRSGAYKGKPFPPATVREGSVWVNRAGKWVAVLNQETPIGQ